MFHEKCFKILEILKQTNWECFHRNIITESEKYANCNVYIVGKISSDLELRNYTRETSFNSPKNNFILLTSRLASWKIQDSYLWKVKFLTSFNIFKVEIRNEKKSSDIYFSMDLKTA